MTLNKKAQNEVIEKIEAMEIPDAQKKEIYKNLGIKKKRREILCAETTVRIWKRIMNSLTVMTDGVLFDFAKDNVEMLAVDPAHVMLLHLKLYAPYFEKYAVYEKQLQVGLPCDKFMEKLSHLKLTDNVCIKLFDDDLSVLHIHIEREGIVIYRVLKLFDAATMLTPNKPRLSLPHNIDVMISVKELLALLKNINSESDHTKWMSDSNKLDFNIACITENTGPDGKPIWETVKIPSTYVESDDAIHDVRKRPVKVASMFSNDYMESALQMINTFSNRIGIQLGNDNPVELSFCKYGDSKKMDDFPFWEEGFDTDKPKLMAMEIMLAPRIETDDNKLKKTNGDGKDAKGGSNGGADEINTSSD